MAGRPGVLSDNWSLAGRSVATLRANASMTAIWASATWTGRILPPPHWNLSAWVWTARDIRSTGIVTWNAPKRGNGSIGPSTASDAERLSPPVERPAILPICLLRTQPLGQRAMPRKKLTRTIRDDGPHPIDIYVGRRLKELRASKRISQTDLGNSLGVTFQQIQKYENGTNRVSASKLYLMARKLGVDIAYFFDGIPDSGTPKVGEDQRYVNLGAAAAISSLPDDVGKNLRVLINSLEKALPRGG